MVEVVVTVELDGDAETEGETGGLLDVELVPEAVLEAVLEDVVADVEEEMGLNELVEEDKVVGDIVVTVLDGEAAVEASVTLDVDVIEAAVIDDDNDEEVEEALEVAFTDCVAEAEVVPLLAVEIEVLDETTSTDDVILTELVVVALTPADVEIGADVVLVATELDDDEVKFNLVPFKLYT